MNVRYFANTDTLLIELRSVAVAETRDLDEDTILDVDADGNVCALTVENASRKTGAPHFHYEHVTEYSSA
jgi:uncharacterized protein YuzE